MVDKKKTYVVVSHTHWDREWYQPFEEFRARLVRMMDSLLDLLDRDPEYRHFVLDGQTVPLDDYLEIRPDRRADVERLVRDGRLLIGPNYMLPDEFLIGGEAHIRNLMFGIRSARQYGRVMMVGYSPDAFGHIAHLPAILRGFGIDSVALWRGVGPEAATSEFRWAAPDGSEVLVLHFPHGYGMFPNIPEDREALSAALFNIQHLLDPFATTSYVCLPNGTDHLHAHEGLSRVIRLANEILADGARTDHDRPLLLHGDYPMLAGLIKQELGGRYQKLPLLTGEFRNSKRSSILPGVLSTRMWAKQRYQHCEDLLARYAEPFAAWTHLLRTHNGGPGARTASDRGLLHQAWKNLLQNGPHDSVTGCSVDAVYKDIDLRFTRCEQLGEGVYTDCQRYLAELAAPPGQATAVVFNPEHGPRTDFCTLRLPVEPGTLPVALVSEDGASIPVQVVERGHQSPLDARERIIAGFIAPDVPEYGYRAFRIEHGDEPELRTDRFSNLSANPPASPDRPLSTQPSGVENDLFRLSAYPTTGTLTLDDKRTGARYEGLNRFVDGGEVGDEYTYCPPGADAFIDSPAAPATVRLLEAGPARHTLEIRMTYDLPARADDDRTGRSEQTSDCEITSRVSLYPGIARVDIETEVHNRAEDHRLRVHFPAGIKSDRSYAEQHFGVVQRPIGIPEWDSSWVEAPMPNHPQKAFVDINDGKHGLMVANRGLPDYEAIEENDGSLTVALTLLRCVGWLSRGGLWSRPGQAGPHMYTPGAQMIGRWTFHYSIIPHDGAWPAAYREAHRFLWPLRAVRTSHGSGVLPAEASLVSIDAPEFILSTLKVAEDDDAVVLRLYNIADHPAEGAVRLNHPYSAVRRVDLNEEHPQPAETKNGAVPLSLKPNEIATLKFGV